MKWYCNIMLIWNSSLTKYLKLYFQIALTFWFKCKCLTIITKQNILLIIFVTVFLGGKFLFLFIQIMQYARQEIGFCFIKIKGIILFEGKYICFSPWLCCRQLEKLILLPSQSLPHPYHYKVCSMNWIWVIVIFNPD